jgi:carboxypeptidase Q
MKRRMTAALTSIGLAMFPLPVAAQTFPTQDSVLRRIWALGMDSTQTYPLAQALVDSIGPRLTGTPQQAAAVDWALARYAAWNIPARKEQYGTSRGWSRGHTHVDLLAPRMRTLDGTLLAWSPGTGGQDVDGDVVLPPTAAENLATWLASVKGKYVLATSAASSCRPSDDWRKWAARNSEPGRPGSLPKPPERVEVDVDQLAAAGVAGILKTSWSGGWGTDWVTGAKAKQVPTVQLSCEDYGLVYRLAENRQGPRLRVNAQATHQGDRPVSNVIAELKGREKPDEYVILSAHLDSWDGASGATDNGTGTILMMEAMRILKAVYPRPKRTILVGHWNGEEQGLNGSKGFVKAHPDVVQGLHVLFNQDNGTGRIASISGQGFTAAGEYFTRWFSRIPPELVRDIRQESPGTRGVGSDYAAFTTVGAPGFALFSHPWSYRYTGHTNRDTFDKISFDDLKANATLVAMLAYLASEDAVKMPR